MDALVSVVIPVYNGEKFIEETLRSVLAQDYASWELLLVDDGSTDGTEVICRNFGSDPRVRYMRQQNQGVSAARNKGIAEAKGEFMAFLDADDVWLKNNLSEKVDFLRRHPGCGLVHSDVEYIDDRSRRLGYINKGREGELLDELLLWEGTCINCPSSILVRHSVVEQLKGFDTAFSTAADQDFYFRLAKSFRVGNIPKVLLLYRVHGNNMSANIALMEADHLGVYRKAERNGFFKSASFRRKCFANLYLILAGSWWVNRNSRGKGLRYMIKAVLKYPPSAGKVLKKLLR